MRKEIKYQATFNDFEIIKNRLCSIVEKDPNCLKDSYTITSLYFDDINKTSYNQVKCGISSRWKYRIRFYNYNDNYIKLEKKEKINGLTNKKSIIIDKKIFLSILNKNLKIESFNEPLLNEFIIKTLNNLLRPIICIEYDRVPYTYRDGNVRITLDYNIRYTNRFDNLFDINKRMIKLDEKVLEIKYDEFIPDFIRYRLQLNNLEETSFSKYAKCMDKMLGGKI